MFTWHNLKFRILSLALGVFMAMALSYSPAWAAVYTVCSSGCDYTGLQPAINAALSDGAASTINITEAGVYSGPFKVPYVEAERSYELSIVGNTASRDDVILDNPTASIAPGIPIPAVIATEFNVIGTQSAYGMPLKLKHLTITASELLVNGDMEGAYNGGLASGWSKAGAPVLSEVTYGSLTTAQGAVLKVLSGNKAQGFTGTDASNYIYTTVSGAKLGANRTYTFSVWFRRTAGAGNAKVMAELEFSGIGTTTVLSTSAVNYADMYNQLTYTFITTANPADLKVKLYCDSLSTAAVVDGAAIASPLTAGVFFKGPAGSTDLQGVEDCVVRNIGHVSSQGGNGKYLPATWNDLDDPLGENGDDVHGHGVVIFTGAAPLIVDNDIRQNYDGVSISESVLGSASVQADNPRLWSTGYADQTYWQMKQRIRQNARFGIAVRNGATPYIGNMNYDTKITSFPLDYANDIAGNGYANIAAQDDAAPRIYYNYIQGNFDYLFDLYYMGEQNPSQYGILSREAASAVIVGNKIYDHNRAAVAVRDNAAPLLGDNSTWISWDGDLVNLDVRVNQIYGNNFYASLGDDDARRVFCNHGAFDNIDCAAVASMDGAMPVIRNNYINYNHWAGVGSRDWAAPDVRGNWIENNVIGMSFMSVRDSATAAARIGGSAAGEGNEVYWNQVGIAVRNSGNRENRVLIEGNYVHDNEGVDRGVGIAVNNSYVQITNNDITSNSAASLWPGRKAAIAVFNDSDVLINYNRILNNRGVGLSAIDSAVEVEHNLLADNFPGTIGFNVLLGGIDVGDYGGYLFNGGFEDNEIFTVEKCCYTVAPEWKMAGSIYASENIVQVKEGGSAQEFGEGGPDSSYLYYPAMVSAGQEYYFSGWLTRASGTGTVYLQLSEAAYNNVYTTFAVTSSAWSKVSFTFKAISNDVVIKLYTVGAGAIGLADGFELRRIKPGAIVRKFNHNILAGDVWFDGRYDVSQVYIEGGALVKELKHNIIGRCFLGVNLDPGRVEHSGTLPVQGALGANEVQLAASAASGNDDAYAGMMLVLPGSGMGLPVEAMITAYNSSTKVATIEYPTWVTPPAAGQLYEIRSRRGRIDANAVDYNLVYAWSNDADTDGVSDGYLLNGALPGENTYYYGEYYGATPLPFFEDPNHIYPSTQDYHIYSNSSVYTYTYKNGALCADTDGQRLGPDCNFTYPPADYQYFWPRVVPFPVSPPADTAAPAVVSINPPDGAASASPYTPVSIYLQDQGIGSAANSGLALDGIVRNTIKVQVNSPVYSGQYSYGDAELIILPDYNNASQYKILFAPAALEGFGIGTVDIGLYAADAQGNIFSNTMTPYSFITSSGDVTAPQLADFFPKPDDVCAYLQPADIPIDFRLTDGAAGVNIYSATLNVATYDMGGGFIETLYNGSIYSYAVISNTPLYSNYSVFYHPECDYDNDVMVNATITAYDYENNHLSTTRKFCIAADSTPPEEVSYLKAKVSAAGVVSLTWDASIDAPGGASAGCVVGGDLAYYELLVCGGGLEDSLLCTFGDWVLWKTNISNLATAVTVYDLPEGKYKFRLRGVDSAGNKSMGALANRNVFYPYGEPLTLYEGFFDEDFNGVSDNFYAAYLNKWLRFGGINCNNSIGSKLSVSGENGEYLAHNFSAGDLQYSADLTLDAGEAGYLLIRKLYGSEVGTTGYAAFVDLANARIGIYDVGDATVVAQAPISAVVGAYNLKLTTPGNKIRLVVTGAASATTEYIGAIHYLYGQAGIWQPDSASGLTVSNVEFDNIVIKDYQDRWQAAGSWNTTGYAGGGYALRPYSDNQDIVVGDFVLPDDFILQADVKLKAEGTQGAILFQKKDEQSVVYSGGYAACIESNGATDTVSFYRIDNGALSVLADTTVHTIDINTNYHLKLLVSGGQFALYASSDTAKPYNYERWLVGSDSGAPFTGGYAGFWQQTGKGYDVSYDNFSFGTTEPFKFPGLGVAHAVTNSVITTEQYANINSAINSAAADGGYVYFDGCNPGVTVYNIGKNVIRMKPGVSFLGEGPDCTVIRGSGPVILYTADDVVVEGIKIEGANKKQIGVYCTNVSPMLIDCKVTNCADAIRIGGSEGTSPTITGCDIYNNARMGIGNNLFSSAWIFDNRIGLNGLNGVGARDNAAPRIEDNLIGSHFADLERDNSLGSQGGLADNQVKLDSGASPTDDYYKNMVLILTSGLGKPKMVRITGYAGATQICTVSPGYAVHPLMGDNYKIMRWFPGNGYVGIALRGNSMARVVRNRVTKNFGPGIGSRDDATPSIERNIVYENAQHGIGNYARSNASVVGNIVYGNANVGIGMHSNSQAEVIGNTVYSNGGDAGIGGGSRASGLIRDNIVYNSENAGIGFHASRGDFEIYNNYVFANAFNGIAIDNAIGSFTVQGNMVVSNGFSSGLDQGGGIALRDFNGTLKLTDNRLHSNNHAGISLIRVNNVTLSNLTATHNGRGMTMPSVMMCAGVRINDCNGIIVENCTIKDNHGLGIAVADLTAGNQVTIRNNIIGGASGAGNTTGGIGIGINEAASNAGTVYINGNNIISSNGGSAMGIDMAGGIAVYNFSGTANIYGNQILENTGTQSAAGGIGIRDLMGGTVNIGVQAANIIRGNIGDMAGGIGGTGGTGAVNINQNEITDSVRNGIGFIRTDVALQINNNQIYKNTLTGVGLREITGQIKLTDNTISSNGNGSTSVPIAAGVAINECADVSITSSNTIRNNNGYGISMADLTSGDTVQISGNTIGGALGAGNLLGGIGVSVDDALTNQGTISISANTISYNQATDRAAGIGLKKFAGTADISNNTVAYNVTTINTLITSGIPGGIGVLEPQDIASSTSVTINNNIINSNQTDPSSTVGGIGVIGASALAKGTLTTLVITSNRISNHYHPVQGKKASGIGIRWIDFTDASLTIRNNKKDNIGIQNNVYGISLLENAGGATASVQISDNRVYSHLKDGIRLKNNLFDFNISKNILDNDTVIGSGGDYGISMLGQSATYVASATLHSNTIKNFGLSGIRTYDYPKGSGLAVTSNLISTNGRRDKKYRKGEPLDDGTTCNSLYSCSAASGIQAKASYFDTVTDNTIRYNLYAGIALDNTDGWIGTVGAGNEISYNGNSTGNEKCPPVAIPGGDGGIAVYGLDAGKKLVISGNSLHDNFGDNVNVNNALGSIIYDGTTIPGGGSSGEGHGIVRDCTQPGSCNETIDCIATPGYQAQVVGNKGYGVLIFGEHAENLIIQNCDIYSNGRNGEFIGCDGKPIGGGVALAMGADPTIRNNNIYNNGISAQPEGSGGNSGINLNNAGSVKIYRNEIYNNANDGISIMDSSTPVIGGDDATFSNRIYANWRFGVGISGFETEPSVSIKYNHIYSNVRVGLSARNTNVFEVIGNKIYDNGRGYPKVPGTTTPDAGIRINAGYLNIIKDNIICTNDGFGVSLAEHSDGDTTIISNNIIGRADILGNNHGNSFAGMGVGKISFSRLEGGIPAGALGYWKFEEGVGTLTYDETVAENNGIVYGASWIASGKSGNALSYDGTDDYAEIAGLIPGAIRGSYYDGTNFDTFADSDIFTGINFPADEDSWLWSDGDNSWVWSGDPQDSWIPTSVGPDYFSMRFDGYVKADADGTYTFYSTADDGQKLWVDNQLVFSDWTIHSGMQEVSGSIALSAGWHSLRLEYYRDSFLVQEATAPPGVILEYENVALFSRQVIPADHFGFNSGTLMLEAPAMTAEAWIYPTAYPASDTAILNKWLNNNVLDGEDACKQYMLYFMSNGHVRWYSSDDCSGTHQGNVESTEALALNTWNHVVAVTDGSKLRLYINASNGIENNSIDWPYSINGVSTGTLQIGKYDNKFFSGVIDEVVLYDRALSSSEVQERFHYTGLLWMAAANDASGGGPGVQAGDQVVLKFSGQTNGRQITAANIDTVLALSDGHTWLDADGTISSALWSAQSYPNDTLTITLSDTNGAPTISVGDTIIMDGSIKDVDDRPVKNYQAITKSFGMPDGLVSLWYFDEGGGLTAFDSADNNDGNINGANWTDETVSGYALEFDGISDNVQVADSASLDLANQITIEGWIKPLNFNGADHLLKKGTVYRLSLASGVPTGCVSISGGEKCVSGATINTNKWTHLALTYDGALLSIYQDGAVYTTTQTGLIDVDANPLKIGESFEGIIDETAVYSRALTTAEVTAIYNLHKDVQVGGTYYIKHNTISYNGGGASFDVTGGIGLNSFAGTVEILNNTIVSNTDSGVGAGGIGIFELSGGAVNIFSNDFRHNTGDTAGAIGASNGIGNLSIIDNTIASSGIFTPCQLDPPVGLSVLYTYTCNILVRNQGIGLVDMSFEDTVIISSNYIYDNSGSGIGIKNTRAQSDISLGSVRIYSNKLHNNQTGAIGVVAPNSDFDDRVEIIKNIISSNWAVGNRVQYGIPTVNNVAGIGTYFRGYLTIANNDLHSNTSTRGRGPVAIGIGKLHGPLTLIEQNNIYRNYSPIGLGSYTMNPDSFPGKSIFIGITDGGEGPILIRNNNIHNHGYPCGCWPLPRGLVALEVGGVLLVDDPDTQIYIENNTLYSNQYGMSDTQLIGFLPEVHIRNNIIWDKILGGGSGKGRAFDSYNSFDFNDFLQVGGDYYNASTWAGLHGPTPLYNVGVWPDFVDEANMDSHLQSTSTLINFTGNEFVYSNVYDYDNNPAPLVNYYDVGSDETYFSSIKRAMAYDASGGGDGLQPGDQVIIDFGGETNGAVLGDLDTALALDNGHIWSNSSIYTWSQKKYPNDTLTITLAGGATIEPGDMITPDGSILNEYGNGIKAARRLGGNFGAINGAVAWWKLDEDTGSAIAVDSVNNVNYGRCAGVKDRWSVLGKYDNAVRFDGDNDYIWIPYGILNGAKQGTIEGWLKPEASPDLRTFVSLEDDNGNGLRILLGADERIRVEATTTTNQWIFSSTAYVREAAWSHVALTWDDTSIRLYINGQPEVHVSATGFALGKNEGWSELTRYRKRLGNVSGTNYYYQGLMDDVVFYEEVLSPAEIATHYKVLFKSARANDASSLGDGFQAGDQVVIKFDGETNGPVIDNSNINSVLILDKPGRTWVLQSTGVWSSTHPNNPNDVLILTLDDTSVVSVGDIVTLDGITIKDKLGNSIIGSVNITGNFGLSRNYMAYWRFD